MAERIVLVGCGGIGSQLLPPLVRYLSNRPEPRSLLVLVDGDVFEPGNRSRQACSHSDLGSNKAEALARVARDDGLAVQAIPEFLDETNVEHGFISCAPCSLVSPACSAASRRRVRSRVRRGEPQSRPRAGSSMRNVRP
jgi:tRNA A37 threonylcarbamoyladenosine dehydratase